MTTLRTLSSGHGFLEGARWHDGRLYASDFFAGTVLAFADDGTSEVVCEVPGRPSGLGWTPSGDLLVVSMLERRLFRFDGRALSEVADLRALAPWHTNDMVVDAAGRAYIGNFGWDDTSDDRIHPTGLIRVDPDGRASIVADDVVFPNGMAITPDGRTLLVAETFAGRITAFDIDASGDLSGRRVWADFSAGRSFSTLTEALASGACLPDGIALTPGGELWVADAARQGALLVAEGGEVRRVLPVEGQTAFAVAVGGPKGDDVFLCTAIPYGSGDPSAAWESQLRVASGSDA